MVSDDDLSPARHLDQKNEFEYLLQKLAYIVLRAQHYILLIPYAFRYYAYIPIGLYDLQQTTLLYITVY